MEHQQTMHQISMSCGQQQQHNIHIFSLSLQKHCQTTKGNKVPDIKRYKSIGIWYNRCYSSPSSLHSVTPSKNGNQV